MAGAGAAIGGWLTALALAGGEAAPPAPEPAPSAELLLFLAEFADAEGRPVDPTEIARALEQGTASAEPAARAPSDPRNPSEADDDAPEDRPR